jgi:hypothetical protein
MKNKFLNVISILTVSALLLAFINCSRPLTFQQSQDLLSLPKSQDIIVGNPMAAKTLLGKICAVVSSCHPQISIDDCQTGVLNTEGIETQLGITKGTTKLYSEIITAENNGLLRADVAAMNSCGAAIEQLSCNDSLVKDAYQPSASLPYAGIAFMIPTKAGSCPAVFTQPPSRAEYFVSITGSDSNDGSAQKPWATINHAAQSLVPGPQVATVHVAAGTYSTSTQAGCIVTASYTDSCGIHTTKSGTATAPIVFISDDLWQAKIIPADADTVWYNSADYVTISGFEIMGNISTNNAIQNDGSFVRIENNKIHDIPVIKGCSRGVGSGGISHTNAASHDNDAIGNLIYNIGSFPGNDLAPSNYCNHADGIIYRQPRGNIQNNILYHIQTWGFVTWAKASNFQITNNLIFDSGTRDNLGNLTGGGIALAANAAVLDYVTVSNNIIRNNSGVALYDVDALGTHNVFLNNAIYANGAFSQFKPGTTDVGSILVDPKMINFKLDGTGDYRLLNSGSPAVNAGTTTCASGTACTPEKDFSGFLRPYGAGIDVGPLEWHP